MTTEAGSAPPPATEGAAATEPAPRGGPRWIDNHCHLPPGHVGDEVVARAVAAGVARFVDVGTDHERSRQVIASAARHPAAVFATVGVHPHDATEGTDGLAELAAHAVGRRHRRVRSRLPLRPFAA